MEQWKVDTAKVKGVTGEQRRLVAELKNLSQQIENTGNAITISQRQAVQGTLRRISEQVQEEAVCLSDHSEKLNQIASLYESTEKRIVGNKDIGGADELKNLSQDYDRTTITFDDDKKNGTYGADQGDMAHNKKGLWFFGFRWFEDEDLYAYIRSHDRYRNYSQTEIAKLMDQINEEGCGYVAIVNNIFTEYEGREAEFQQRFGFPMYDKKGKANYDYLIVDFYASTDDKYYLNDPKGAAALVNDVILGYIGKEDEFRKKYGCDPLTADGHITPEAKQQILDSYSGTDVAELKMGGITEYSIENRFRHYLDEKGLSYECEEKSNLSVSDVDSYLDSGKNVNIATGSFNLYNEKGKAVARNVGDHWMTITGVTEDGRYIVSSWGERYYLNPSELTRQDFFITDVSAS